MGREQETGPDLSQHHTLSSLPLGVCVVRHHVLRTQPQTGRTDREREQKPPFTFCCTVVEVRSAVRVHPLLPLAFGRGRRHWVVGGFVGVTQLTHTHSQTPLVLAVLLPSETAQAFQCLSLGLKRLVGRGGRRGKGRKTREINEALSFGDKVARGVMVMVMVGV